MITQEQVSIQHGIAQFMHGGTYGSQMMIDPFEEAVRRPIEDSVKNLDEYISIRGKVFLEEMQHTMQNIGCLPERCLSCPSFKSSLSSNQDHARLGSHTFRARVRCDRNGCDSARQDYIENFQTLSSKGKAAISIDVEVDAEMESVESRIDVYGRGYSVSTSRPKDRIQIKASVIDPMDGPGCLRISGTSSHQVHDRFDPNEYFSYGEVKSYSKETPAHLQEQEIAELLEMQSTSDLSRYGEVAW